jgi:hypothetical protein
VIGDGPVIGRRARFIAPSAPGEPPEAARPGPWLEIVGVAGNLEASIIDPAWAPPAVFYPVAPGELRAVTVLVRVRNGDLAGAASRLRHIAAEVDPDLRFGAVGNHASMIHSPVFTTMVAALAGVLLSVVLLSAAGIHALTSLAVTRRRKEIGIRRAIGSRTGSLLGSIFSRVAWQLGLGALAGSIAGGALLVAGGRTGREIAAYVGGVVVLMLLAGLIATVGPALRGLGIQPIQALREE